jgi:hypothetical protein
MAAKAAAAPSGAQIMAQTRARRTRAHHAMARASARGNNESEKSAVAK